MAYEHYATGIVLVTNVPTSDVIKVFPIDKLALASGDLATKNGTANTIIVNANGIKENLKINTSMGINAKWIGGGDGNRVSAPNVYLSEQVEVLTFADTGEFFWRSLAREPSLRGLEEEVLMLSNVDRANSKNHGVVLNKDNSYWFKWSTVEKVMHWHTSKNDGEPYAYDFILDTANGSFTIKDDIGNVLELNSAQRKLRGNIGTLIDLTAPDIVFNGNVTHNGNTVHNGLTTNNGDVTTNANCTVTGDHSVVGVLSFGSMSGGAAGGVAGTINGQISLNGTIISNGSITAPNLMYNF